MHQGSQDSSSINKKDPTLHCWKSSLDLNQLNYKVWSEMQKKGSKGQIKHVDNCLRQKGSEVRQ